jgi:phosphatidate cytidylyltransferase
MLLTHLTSEVRYTLVAVFVALIVSSVIVYVLRKLKPERDFTELYLRVRTWWLIAVLFTVAMILSRPASLLFLAVVSWLALREFLSLLATEKIASKVLFWAYLSVPFQYYWVYEQWYGMFIIFIPVYLFMLIPTQLVLLGQTEGFLRRVGTLHWGLMTTVYSLSHAAFLLVLQPIEKARIAPAWPMPDSALSPGPGLLILLVLLTQLNDVFQFLWGKSLGKRRIVPQVSPGKTWAGFIGGVASTVLLAWILGPRLTLLDGPRALMAGLIIGLGGFAGDVSISALKRDLGVKDSGTLLPGHGGILDRVDSLTFTAPLFFHFVWYSYC